MSQPDQFTALVLEDAGDGKVTSSIETLPNDRLPEGEVTVGVEYSTLNYKDGMIVKGIGRLVREFPHVPGIDFAGTVETSDSPDYKPGDRVVLTGWRVGEVHWGGFTTRARVRADWLVPLPEALSTEQAMAIGTAGFTAALAVDRMEQNDQTPEHGPILVTGATGGVGSVAIDILSGCGYEVVALTGKAESEDYLKSLGASSVLLRQDVDLGKRPMERAEWGGAIDNLGGEVLTWLTRTTKPFGNIAAIGLAASWELNTTVMPFILRGVSLLGINSVLCAPSMRVSVWERLGSDLKPRHLDKIVTRTVAFDDLPGVFDDFIEGKNTGRTVVTIGGGDG